MRCLLCRLVAATFVPDAGGWFSRRSQSVHDCTADSARWAAGESYAAVCMHAKGGEGADRLRRLKRDGGGGALVCWGWCMACLQWEAEAGRGWVSVIVRVDFTHSAA